MGKRRGSSSVAASRIPPISRRNERRACPDQNCGFFSIIATAAMMFRGSAEAWTIAAAAIIAMIPAAAPRMRVGRSARALPTGWNALHWFPNSLRRNILRGRRACNYGGRRPPENLEKTLGDGGLARNRTGVQGFAVLCVTTPPRGQSPAGASEALPIASG